MLALALLAAPAAACDDTARSDLRDALQRADGAYEAMDGEDLDAAMGDVRGALDRQCAPASPRLAFEVHHAFARHLWTLFDTENSVRAYLAVKDLAPAWTVDLDAAVPDDHPVRGIWDSRPGWTVALDESPPGGWMVDGEPSPKVPKDRAFLLQALDRDGSVTWTGWLLHPREVPLAPWRAERVRRIRGRGTLVSLAVAGAGAGLLTAGLLEAGRVDDVPPEDRLKVQNRANTLQAGAIGAFVLSGVSLGLLWGIRW
jgi:hypothetical protein